jgi:hypothetical protein
MMNGRRVFYKRKEVDLGLQLWGPKSMTLASTQHPLRKESMEGITW